MASNCARATLVSATRAELQAGRYAHARQYRRMRGQLRKLRGWLGRVIRDIERKTHETLPQALAHKLALAKRLHTQRREDSNKLYALHAPEVECVVPDFSFQPAAIA